MTVKRIHVKVFKPGNAAFDTLYVEAPKGKSLTDKGEEEALRRAVEQVEQMYPEHEYRLVKISRKQYNIVWVRKLPETITDIVDSGEQQ